MDFKSALSFIASHYTVISGTTLALFFLTSGALLIRSIGQKDGGSGGDGLDLRSIEGALKRVLASQPVSVVGAVVAAPGGEAAAAGAAPGDGEDDSPTPALRQLLQDREQKIEQLGKELEEAKANATANAEAAANAGGSQEVAAMKTKMEELQARLAEYEIIEDDIADLSMFKEENAKLKEENAQLKSQLASAPKAAPTPAPAAPPPQPETVVKFEKTEKIELNPDDEVLKEFAAAVSTSESAGLIPPASNVTPLNAEARQAEVDSAVAAGTPPAEPVAAAPAPAPEAEPAVDPILGEATDPEKLLSEVETISTQETTVAGDALEESLDTDKLLAEVDSLQESGTPAAASEEDPFAELKKTAQG